MKKILIIVVTVFLWGYSVDAQKRYLDEITDAVDIGTYTYSVKDGEELKLDVYTPMYDSEYERATFIYVHGGGFQSGSRDEPLIQDFCKDIAKRGYVVASVSYRLTRKDTETGFGCDCDAMDKLATFDNATMDLQDAIFFLIQQREMLGIDPQKIILAGSSAGAETVLNTAYTPPMCYDLPSGPVSYAGVISMAGAIPSLNVLYEESAIPSLFFHGTCDELVPYATAPHHYCDEDDPGYLELNGAYSIANKLDELGTPYWLYSVCGGDHGVATSPIYENVDDILQFCYDFAINGSKEQIRTITPSEVACENTAFSYDFCNE